MYNNDLSVTPMRKAGNRIWATAKTTLFNPRFTCYNLLKVFTRREKKKKNFSR